MQRTRFDTMPCPIARSLERVGEWWSMPILRDAFAGLTRFVATVGANVGAGQQRRALRIALTGILRRLIAVCGGWLTSPAR